MTTEMEVEKITATSIALRPPYKSRTSEPWPWADGQKRGVVEVGKHLCAPASRVAKSDRRCLLHRPLEPPGGHTLTGLMVPTVAFVPSKEATVRLQSAIADLRGL